MHEVARELTDEDSDPNRLRSSVGRCLSRLNFKRCRVGDKSFVGYRWDDKLVQDLVPRFLGFGELTPYLSYPQRNPPESPILPSQSLQYPSDSKMTCETGGREEWETKSALGATKSRLKVDDKADVLHRFQQRTGFTKEVLEVLARFEQMDIEG